MKREDTPMWNDPEEPAYVRELLDAGRNAPAEYDVASGLAAHLSHVKAGTALPYWAKAGASGGMSTGAIVAWIAVPVVTAAVAASVYVASQRDVQPSAAPRQPVQASPQLEAVSALPVDVARIESAARQVPRPAVLAPAPVVEKAPQQVIAAKPARTERPAVASRNELAAKVSAPKPTSSPSSVAARSESAPQATASLDKLMLPGVSATKHTKNVDLVKPEPRAQAAAEEAAPQAAQKSEPAAPAALDDARLEREMRMLSVAQRMVSEDPERALRMAEQGEREFPRSMFSAERQQVALLAMVKLGRVDEARRIGQPFLTKYPNAPWSARLRRALASGRVE